MNKPHKHRDIIKAWADGAQIQYLDPSDGKWEDVDDPAWNTCFEYRIKPQTLRYRVGVYTYGEGLLTITAATDEQEKGLENWPNFKYWVSDWIEVEV